VVANALWAAVLLPGVLISDAAWGDRPRERYLERRFGEEYWRYKARVRRWI